MCWLGKAVKRSNGSCARSKARFRGIGPGRQPMAARSVYRCIIRNIRWQQQQGLPITGVVQLSDVHSVLDPWTEAAQQFRSQRPLADGFTALRSLSQQHTLLLGAEEETLQALQQWAHLQAHWAAGPRQQWCALSSMAAVEQGALLLYRLHVQQRIAQLLLEEEVEEQQQGLEDTLQQTSEALDRLAGQVQQHAPQAFEAGQEGAATCTLEQLTALTQVLFQQQRFRCEPVEWVYDGLDPLLLPGLMQRRKGVPLALAVLLVAVGRRLGLPLHLVCARDGQAPGVTAGLPHLQELPPEVAARQAARSLAAPPAPNNWLVAAALQDSHGGSSRGKDGTEHNSSSSSSTSTAADGTTSTASSSGSSPSSTGSTAAAGNSGWMLLDPARKGQLMDQGAALTAYPSLAPGLLLLDALLAAQQQGAAVAAPLAGAAAWSHSSTSSSQERVTAKSARSDSRKPGAEHMCKLQQLTGHLPAGTPRQQLAAAVQLQAGVVTLWAELARVMVMAHQRRGESDAVAHWLYQLLALDTQAPEWQQLMGQQEGQ